MIVGEKDFNFKMPAKDTVALDDDVELRTVALASPLNRTMVKDALYTEETVETAKGKVVVAFAGDRKKPAIVTYHDLGLNYISNFQARMLTDTYYVHPHDTQCTIQSIWLIRTAMRLVLS